MSSRWQEIANALRASIAQGALQPGNRLPSETELAEQWQVCRMTAHRAMDELQREGLVLRKRRAGTVVAPPAAVVSKSAADLAPGSAQPTRAQETASGAVALLFFHANDLPQADYIQGIRDGLPDSRHLLFCDMGNDPSREAQQLERIRHEVGGIIAYPTCAPQNTPLYREMLRQGVPVVCVDRVPDALEADAVVTDNYGSTLDALRGLTNRGHRRIVFLAYEEERRVVSSVRERRAAYDRALQEIGEDPERWTRLLPRALGHDLPRMVNAVSALLLPLMQQTEAPTALFCKDDFVLAAALEACDSLCLPIPEKLEIASFSDYTPLTLRHTRAVHRLVQQSRQMGRIAAENLLARIDAPNTPVQTVRLPAVLHTAEFLLPKWEAENKTAANERA